MWLTFVVVIEISQLLDTLQWNLVHVPLKKNSIHAGDLITSSNSALVYEFSAKYLI